MIRFLGRPVPEAGAKTVGHGRDLVLPEHPAQLLLLELLAEPIGKQIRSGSLHQRPCPVQNLQCTTTQRDPVLAVRLRPPGRYGPHTLVPIDLGPLGGVPEARITARNPISSTGTARSAALAVGRCLIAAYRNSGKTALNGGNDWRASRTGIRAIAFSTG